MDKVVKLLTARFVFAYHGGDDIAQQIRLFCIEALPAYDPAKPLAPFLFSHSKNRLMNMVRDQVRRPGSDAPCQACHAGKVCGPEGTYCRPYAEWKGRNDAKSGILCPADFSNVPEDREAGLRDDGLVEEQAQLRDVLERIDMLLPIELRADYLRMRDAVRVSPARRKRVEDAVRQILELE